MADADNGAMLIESDGSWFRMRITGYQFPENEHDEWDSNWLIIAGRVCLDGREWQFADPCLTTREALCLAGWLDALSRGAAPDPTFGLTEPNLQFERKSSGAIRISFALESAPPWAQRGDDWDKHGFEVPIGQALSEAAAKLRDQLVQFPERARA